MVERDLLDVRKDKGRIQRSWRELELGLSVESFLSWAWIENWLKTLPAGTAFGCDGVAVHVRAPVVNLLLHSSGLAYGCSPFSAIRTGVATVWDRLHLLLKGARRLRMQPGTLTSAAHRLRALNTVATIGGESRRIETRNGEAGNGH